MKRNWICVALVGVLASTAHAERYLQSEPKTFELDGARRIRIEFPIGKFTLEGDDGETVRTLVRIDCKGSDYDECKDEARRIRIDHSTSGRTFLLEFTGIRKKWADQVTVEARVLVPRELAAEINVGVGTTEVTGMRGDLEVEMGVGELSVRGRQSDYREVEAEAGVGDASIDTRRGRVRERGFIGHSAHWSDPRGTSTIRAHVGVGQANVDLR